MRLWQLIRREMFMNTNLLIPMHTFQTLESVCWDLGCSCNELDNLGELLLVEGLEDLPEPDNLFVCFSVTLVVCVLFKVFEVDGRETGH